MAIKNVLDENGTLYLWNKVKSFVSTAVAGIKLPSKTSELTNDSGYITAADIPPGVAASTTTPKKDGTAAVGTETAYARGDHVHPTDSSRLSTSGDGSKVTVTFTAAATREAPATGETLKVLLGKLLKIYSDTKAVAFSGSYNDLANTPTIPTVPAISTNIATDAASNTKTASPKAVADYVSSRISSVYKASGSVAFTSLPTPAAGNLGNVYNVTDAFTTSASFVEGAGKVYPAGTNVTIVKIGDTYKLDVLSGFVDLSGYMLKTDITAITNAELDSICV